MKVDKMLRFVRSRTPIGSPENCWEWQGYIDMKGYGAASIGPGKKSWKAHRLAFLCAHGRIDDSLMVIHSCDNRRCVNPAHLRQGTARDNRADCVSRGRHYAARKVVCVRGHPMSGDNIYTLPSGKERACRACRRIRRLKHAAVRRARGEA